MPHTYTPKQQLRWEAIGKLEDTLRNVVDREEYNFFLNLLLSATLAESITHADARDIHLRATQRWDRLTNSPNRIW